MKETKMKSIYAFLGVAILSMLIGGATYQCSLAKATILGAKKIVLEVGKSKKMPLKKEKLRKKIKWSSSKKNVVAVNKRGVIIAKKAGVAKVTAKYKKKKYTCTVTVIKQNAIITEKPVIKPEISPSAKPEVTVAPTPLDTSFPLFIPESVKDSVEVERRKSEVEVGDDWETAKVSGTEEDYEKYFKLDGKAYKNQDGIAHGQVKDIVYPSRFYGTNREASIYLPPNYDSKKRYPVVYMLHGINCDKTQWTSMGAGTMLDNLLAKGEAAPVIAVFPSVIPKNGLGKWQENVQAFADFEKEFIYDLEPFIRANYAVSTDRKYTAICGLSMGGMEALCTGFTLIGHFNYIGSFSAAPTLNTSLLKVDNKEDTPDLVMLCSGTKDSTVTENPYNYHKTLADNGVDHIWYQFTNGGHEPAVWDNGLINFMKRIF